MVTSQADKPLQLPTPLEHEAYVLHHQEKLNDSQIAKLLGVRRETICRRRGRFIQKVQRVRKWNEGASGNLLQTLLAFPVRPDNQTAPDGSTAALFNAMRDGFNGLIQVARNDPAVIEKAIQKLEANVVDAPIATHSNKKSRTAQHLPAARTIVTQLGLLTDRYATADWLSRAPINISATMIHRHQSDVRHQEKAGTLIRELPGDGSGGPLRYHVGDALLTFPHKTVAAGVDALRNRLADSNNGGVRRAAV